MVVQRNTYRLRAMTLTELLIVMAILGILILLAYPIVMPIFQKAHSKEAQIQLKHLCTLEKTYFLEYSRYSSELKAVGYEQAPLVSESEKGTAQYRVEIVEATHTHFVGRATAVTDFDGDGQMNVWEVDESCVPQEVVED